ncbi:hypothetical protein GQ457_06G014380 [Hibiscus cannabinus]
MSSASFSPPPPPIFVGENYHLWVVKMKTYLQVYDLWEVVEIDRDPPALRANPTLAQMRQHNEECAKKHKAMSCIQNVVSDLIFTRIMACETPKQAWDKLKEEFMGTEKTRQQQLLNLRRDFENLKMKESEIVKQYSDRIMGIVNNIRLLGDEFSENRIVENVITTLPENESKISSLEDLRGLSSIFLSELINALYAQEKRRATRQQEHSEAAFQAKSRERASSSNIKGKKNWIDRREKPRRDKDNAKDGEKKKSCKQLGHMEKVCKNKVQQQQNAQAQAADGNNSEEEQMFTATCYATSCKTNENWLIDSGCTNHMASDESMFKNIDRTCISRIKIGNGQFIEAKGRGDVLVNTPTCTKIIYDVLLVPDIDQNLLSVGQLLENNYPIVFKNKSCLIFDPTGCELVSVAMNERSFVLDWNSLTSNAYSSIIDETNLWHKSKSEVELSKEIQTEADMPGDLVGDENNAENSNVDQPIRGTRLLSDVYERCSVAVLEPTNFEEAFSSEGWKKAMQNEMSMIQKNQTWVLVDRPIEKRVIGVKWVFRMKLNVDGSVNRLKARLVVEGYAQQFGVDYSETFAPVTSDWVGSIDDMKSTSGYVFTLGSGVFSLSSKKQDTVAQPTAEAEYIDAAGAINQAIWLRKLLFDLNLMQEEATEIYCDNQFVVAIAKNPIFHGKTKHFKIKFHFVREVEQNNEITLVHCSSENQLANIRTKPLSKIRFEDLRMQIGVRSRVAKEEC